MRVVGPAARQTWPPGYIAGAAERRRSVSVGGHPCRSLARLGRIESFQLFVSQSVGLNCYRFVVLYNPHVSFNFLQRKQVFVPALWQGNKR